MVGGSVYIALIRFTVTFVGVILLFFLLSEPRFGRKKTVICYSCCGGSDWKPCCQQRAICCSYKRTYCQGTWGGCKRKQDYNEYR